MSAPDGVNGVVELRSKEDLRFPKLDRDALRAIAPYAYSAAPKDPRDPYRGCEGRPEDSIEVTFTKRKPLIRDPRVHSDPRDRAAAKIQNVQRFWTAPRRRAALYDPTLPKEKLTRPGTTRLAGEELTSREVAALHYLIGQGRLGETQRSLSQLLERGTPLTEKTYLSMCILARRLGDHTTARLVTEHAESWDLLVTERLYSETVTALLATGSLGDAEAVALRATARGLLLNVKVRRALEAAGSQTADQWYARWRLAKMRKPADCPSEQRAVPPTAPKPGRQETPPTGDAEWPGLVITKKDGSDRYVLLDPLTRSPFWGRHEPPRGEKLERLPLDGAARAAEVTKLIPPSLRGDRAVRDRLEGYVHADPHGHAALQPHCRLDNLPRQFPAGENVTPPLRAVLEPRPGPDPAASTPLEVVAWHLELSTEEEEKTGTGKWVPLPQAILALQEADYLTQWMGLLIDVSAWGCPRCGPGSVPPPYGRTGMPHVLVACEMSQVLSSRLVQSAWAHAVSADLIPGEIPGYPHLTQDVSSLLHCGWCFLVGHPPCTYLSLASGCYWSRPGRLALTARASQLFLELYYAPASATLIENPKQTPRAREAIGLLQKRSRRSGASKWILTRAALNMAPHGNTVMHSIVLCSPQE